MLLLQALHKAIKTDLVERGTAKNGSSGGEFKKVTEIEGVEDKITAKVIEDIKVRLCFVTELERGHQIQQVKLPYWSEYLILGVSSSSLYGIFFS